MALYHSPKRHVPYSFSIAHQKTKAQPIIRLRPDSFNYPIALLPPDAATVRAARIVWNISTRPQRSPTA